MDLEDSRSRREIIILVLADKGPLQAKLFSTFPKKRSEPQHKGHYGVMVQISAVNPCSTSWHRDTVKCLAVTGSCQRGIIFVFVPVLQKNVYVSVQINLFILSSLSSTMGHTK